MKVYLIIMGLIFQVSAANATSVTIKDLFCTSALNHPAGITQITYLGNNLFNISNTPFLGLPFAQNAALEKADVDGNTLTLKLGTLVTNATLFLEMNSSTNKITLYADQGQSSIKMTCQTNIDVE
jgi:hypothetical protein